MKTLILLVILSISCITQAQDWNIVDLVPEPRWTDYPPLRQVGEGSLGKVLADIESHMPAGHIYRDSDKITWGHETSHGIASNLRNKANSGQLQKMQTLLLPHNKTFELKIPVQSGGRKNGFYCLENQAVIITEPNTTIQRVAPLVPRSLRGGVYQLYLISQAGSWGDTPLYLCDEWIGYTNGAEVRLDLGIKSRGETLKFALEFMVYSACIAQASKSQDPQLRNFLMWNTYRCRWLYDESDKKMGLNQPALTYIKTLQTSQDAEGWRQFVRGYYGQDFCKEIMGF